MFRKMRRFKQEVSREECVRVLKEAPRGVLSVIGEDGYPYGLPINYVYDEKNDKIYFHGAREGHKIDALKKDNRVSFCVYDRGFRRDGEWALNITSVIAFGKISFMEIGSEESIEAVRALGDRFYEDKEELEKEVQTGGKRAQMLVMTIDHMTGKLVNES